MYPLDSMSFVWAFVLFSFLLDHLKAHILRIEWFGHSDFILVCHVDSPYPCCSWMSSLSCNSLKGSNLHLVPVLN